MTEGTPPHTQQQSGESEGLSSSTDGNEVDTVTIVVRGDRQPPELVTAVFEYQPRREDELCLKRGSVVEVLSKDVKVSGDAGWWTGKCENKVGFFPSNFVQSDLKPPLKKLVPSQETQPVVISFDELTFSVSTVRETFQDSCQPIALTFELNFLTFRTSLELEDSAKSSGDCGRMRSSPSKRPRLTRIRRWRISSSRSDRRRECFTSSTTPTLSI